MRVMCVKNFAGRSFVTGEPMDTPKVLDEDVVTETIKCIWGTFYTLERFGPESMFVSEKFAILPDQDSEEMREESHEAIIYQR